MKNKALVLLFFVLLIGVFSFSKANAQDRFLLLYSSDKMNYYLDSATLAVTKNDINCIYYDAWLKWDSKQEVQQINIYTKKQDYLDYKLLHVIIAVTEDKRMIQVRSITDYGKSGDMIFTRTEIKPTFADIGKGTLAEAMADKIEEYVLKNHIEPIAAAGEKYLPLNEKEFYELFETKGYKLDKLQEIQGPVEKGYNYTSSTTPYSFLDKAIDREVYLSVSGQDKQQLKRAFAHFYVEGPNYNKSKMPTYNLPPEEKLNLFYRTLQALFPDWAPEESKNWVNSTIARMDQSNTLMFVYLHKDKEYIMLSRQPLKDNVAISYILEVSQIQPSIVNPIRPYFDRDNSICVYEEWKPAGK